MKTERLKLYRIDMKYARELSHVDDRVMSVSPQEGKDNRPFLGIVVVCDKKQYCIPLSSPKPKHEKMKNDTDFCKVYDKRGNLIGVMNFNNMVPVNPSVIFLIDIQVSKADTPKEAAYKRLLNNQLDWCNDNIAGITARATKLYRIVTETPDKLRNLTRRCCDFKRLEAVLERYLEKKTAKQQGEAYIQSLPTEQTHYLRLSEKALQVLQQDGSIPMVVKKKSETEYLAKIALADKPKVDTLLEQAAKQTRKE